MPRDMTTAAANAAEAERIIPIVMVDFDFESGHTRVHSGVSPFVFEGNTYTGLGELGKISTFDENADLQSTGIQLTLSGVDPAKLAIALDTHYQGRTVIVYIGFLSTDHQLIEDPVVLWRGRMDYMTINIGVEAVINITAQNPLADWDRPRERRYNSADQQARYPGDLGFEFVEQSVNEEVLWGAPA